MFDRKDIYPIALKGYSIQLKGQNALCCILNCVIIFAAFIFFQPVSAHAASVTLSAAPASRTIYVGQSTTYTININRDGYAGNVTLSASNLPGGATASFNPNPTTGKSSVLTVTTKTTTPTGTFTIKVSASASGISIAPINVTLIINPAPITVTAIPTTQSIIAGQSTSYDLRITRNNYNGPVTLSVSGLPSGVTATFDQNPIYGNSGRMRIYSHLLPFVTNSFDFHIKASVGDLYVSNMPVVYLVNCGIHWLGQFGSTETDFARDVTVDSNGNIYVVGDTQGTVDSQNPFQGATDAWVAKYNSNGQLQWIRQIGTDTEDHATEVAVDSNGNVFVGGYTNGEFANNTRIGGFDFWFAKYNSAGSQAWVWQNGTQAEDGAGGEFGAGFGVEIVPNGSGGTLVTFTNDRTNVSTFSFDNNGILTLQSNGTIPRQLRDHPSDLALGPNDTVFVFGESVDDFWVVKFDSQRNGTILTQSSTSAIETATRIAVDSSGNYVITGTTKPSANDKTDAFVIKYDGNGAIQWAKTESSPENDFINAVGIDSNGDVVIAGMTQGVLGERNGDMPPREDAWVAKLQGSNGNLVWVRQFPVEDIDSVKALALGNQGLIYLAGYTVLFKSNIGVQDAWVMRYSSVTNPNFLNSITDFFNVTTNMSQASGRVNDRIRINGLFWGSVTGVRFNGVPAVITSKSLTQIEVIVPQGATSGTVTVLGDCESVSSPMQFTVL